MRDRTKLRAFELADGLTLSKRLYVKEAQGVVWFRMWNAADPTLREQHDGVPYAAILRAAEMYDGKNFDPRRAYDIDAARALLDEGN